MMRRLTGLGALLLIVLAARPAAAQWRLRGDVLAGVAPPVGLVVLEADGRASSWLSAEAVVWTGATSADSANDALGVGIGRGDSDIVGDVQVITLHMRAPSGRAEARVGRFIAAVGALPPLHLDGAAAVARQGRFRVEGFAGIPAVPRLGAAEFDWTAGGRVARRFGKEGALGLAYYQRRGVGRLEDEEVGVDAAWPGPVDVAARAALDLQDPIGLSDAHLSAAARSGPLRVEVFVTSRSPSRRLPATSLFSVLGDVPAHRAGVSARMRAAPRLDVDLLASLRAQDGEPGGEFAVRALLRLDDRGDGAVGLELRRDMLWTGTRAFLRAPMGRLTGSLECEAVIADDPHGRGAVWPWALAALRAAPARHWEAALALEASASPEYSSRMQLMASLSRRWDVP